MSGDIVRSFRPESEELALRREELAGLLTALFDRELELSTLRHDLARLEAQYLREIGPLYSEFDSWNARIRELRAQRNPSLAGEGGERDDQTGACGAASQHYAAPSPELKLLYRNAARRIHPDLTCDPLEQERRTRFMAEANRAYRDADAEALQRILEEFHYDGHLVEGESAGAELARLIRQIRDGKERITAVDRELSALRGSEIARLHRDVQMAAADGRDLLAELAATIVGQIDRAKKIYANLARGLAGLRA